VAKDVSTCPTEVWLTLTREAGRTYGHCKI